MSATIRLALLLLLQLGCLGTRHGSEARHHPEPHQDNAVAGKSTPVDHEHKLLLECQHSDYRTYIKCLKREKRQHYNEPDNRRSCLDECLDRNCTNHACTRDCYTHCKQRVIEVNSKTIETTYDCANGDCNSNVPNITTNIHIQNIPPNITLHCEKKPGSSNGSDGTNGMDGTTNHSKDGVNSTKIDINNVINNFIQQPTPAVCPCPGCYCYHWQPQITIGFGLGGGPMGEGCMYSSWPCIQKNPADCSMCNNPFLRYQCSPNCIPSQNSTIATSRHGSTGNPADRQYNGNGYRNGR